MFSLLLSSVLANTIIIQPDTKHKDSLFNFNYVNEKRQTPSLTYEDRGVFVGFRLYDEKNQPGPVHLITSNEYHHKISDKGEELVFIFSTTTARTQQPYATATMSVINKGYYEKKIDIGYFIDCNFQNGETKTINKIDGEVDYNRGYIVTSKAPYEYALLLKNTGFTPYPDTTYIGDLGNSMNVDPTYYPFFKNEIAKTTGSDSVIAFAWTNQTLVAESYYTFKFGIAPTKKVNAAPIILDRTEYKPVEQIKAGDKIDFKFEIIAFDMNEMNRYNIFINPNSFEDGKEDKSGKDKDDKDDKDGKDDTSKLSQGGIFYPKADNYRKNIKFETYTLPPAGCYITASVFDAAGQMTRLNFDVYPYAKPPFQSFTAGPKKEYYITDKIDFSGHINLADKGNLMYQFENGPILKAKDGVTSDKDFSGTIPIPFVLKKRQNYTVHFWAQYGPIKSEVKDFTFYLRDQESPELISLYSSDYAYTKGKTNLVIFGEAHDQEEKQALFIYHKIDMIEKNRASLGKFTNNPSQPFALFFELPKTISTGIHNIGFDIEDETNLKGKTNRSVTIRVCNDGEVCYAPGEEPPEPPSSSSSPIKPVVPTGSSAATNKPDESLDENAADKEYKSKMPVIWALTVFNLIAVLILLIMGVIYLRKRMHTYDAFEDNTTTEGDEEISESAITPAPGSVSQTVDNPLFSTGIPQSDDVFATDYHEETTVDVFKFNNDEEDPDLCI